MMKTMATMTRWASIAFLLALPWACGDAGESAGEDAGAEPTNKDLRDGFEKAMKGTTDGSGETDPASEEPTVDNGGVKGLGKSLDGMKKPVESRLDHGDVPGLPETPTLTGDRAADKAAIIAALEKLQAAWKKNKQAHADLIKAKQTKASPELKKVERYNEAYQACSDRLQDLLDALRDG